MFGTATLERVEATVCQPFPDLFSLEHVAAGMWDLGMVLVGQRPPVCFLKLRKSGGGL